MLVIQSVQDTYNAILNFHTEKQPTDHGQANVNRMRQIQRQSRQNQREKEENKPTPVKALWKSTRYDNIEPKVKTTQTQVSISVK